MSHLTKATLWNRYAYAWITLAFFLLSFAGHWLFGWFAYVNEQQAHQMPVRVGDYSIEMLRDTLENWHSEFLQPPVAGRRPRPAPLYRLAAEPRG